MSAKELEYLKILEAIELMPFNVGKNLLVDFLNGNESNESVKRNKLSKKEFFGYFSLYQKNEIENMLENLIHNDLIEVKPLNENRFIKVLSLTEKGKKELVEPNLYKKKLSNNFRIVKTNITDEDKKVFEVFGFFLKSYNDDQKKAIISKNNKILCIAGAGSGKTTVLTKRIEFLVTFKSAIPEKILAITFTRKARREMSSRLSKSQYCQGVMAETFNSFCEKIIKAHESRIYKRKTRVMSYSDKITIFKAALKEANIDFTKAVSQYFSYRQISEKTNEELIKILMNDCYSVIEIYKMNKMDINALKEYKDLHSDDQKNLNMIYEICGQILSLMKKLA